MNLERRRVLVGLTALAWLASGARPAVARERLAVLIIGDDDALADSLSEVAISHLAKRGDWELAGTRELRGRLAPVLPDGGLRACLPQASCLAAIGGAANVEIAVIGDVRRNGDSFQVELSLTNLRTARIDGHFSGAAPADQNRLIDLVRDGLDAVFAPQPLPSAAEAAVATPAAALPRTDSPTERPDVPGAAAPAPPPDLDLDRSAASSHRSSILPYLGLGATAGAVVSFSAAAVTGSFANAALVGNSRAELQADLDRRGRYGTAADILLAAGSVFTTVTVVAFYKWWRAERAGAARPSPDGGHGLTP